MENRFNLIDEPWIPVADVGRVSLRQIFSEPHYRALGGNPVQKIALMKLLLAIAQAAATPADDQEWRELGAEGLASRCLEYLDKWHDRFYLYGERPFLQVPEVERTIIDRTSKRISKAKTSGKTRDAVISGAPKPIGAGFYPDLPSTNNTELSQTLFARDLSAAERAVFLVSLMNFAFGGKRVESDLFSLYGEALGSHYSAPAGPSLGGWIGQLHCYPLVDSILGSIWLNMLTSENVRALNRWPGGFGRPAWEVCLKSPRDATANTYKTTYQACLIAFCRFVSLRAEGIYYLDGINYPKVKDGWTEPSLVIDLSGDQHKARYVDPQKRPWRELESLLAYNIFASSSGSDCPSLKIGIERAVDAYETIFIWCAGIKVSSNSGDQSVKQDDDFVESSVGLRSDWISGRLGGFWFAQLQAEMAELNKLAKSILGCVKAYFSSQKVDNKKLASQAEHLFWQLCERDFQQLLDSCDPDEVDQKIHQQARRQLRRRFADYAQQAYDRYCPNDTARQLDAWAKCRPNHAKYLAQEA